MNAESSHATLNKIHQRNPNIAIAWITGIGFFDQYLIGWHSGKDTRLKIALRTMHFNLKMD